MKDADRIRAEYEAKLAAARKRNSELEWQLCLVHKFARSLTQDEIVELSSTLYPGEYLTERGVRICAHGQQKALCGECPSDVLSMSAIHSESDHSKDLN